MPIDTPHDQERIAMLPDLGIDTRGYVHRVDRAADAVHVCTPGGDVARTIDLDGRALDEYRAFVAVRRGWVDETDLSGGPFDGLAETIVAEVREQ